MKLPRRLRDRTFRRLGFDAAPAADEAGLRAVYQAWCRNVPFDNVRKVTALRVNAAGPLPGIDAEEFFEEWLAGGVGATCWPTANAFHALAESAGFQARRIAGSMRDIGVSNHGSVVVSVPGGEWLADTSLLVNDPLPLGAGGYRQPGALFEASVTAEGGGYVIRTRFPHQDEPMPCRLHPGAVSWEYFRGKYEESRERSPFNHRLYARRNGPDRAVAILGKLRFVRTAGGVETRALNADELRAALKDEIRISARAVREWEEAGGLEACFEAG